MMINTKSYITKVRGVTYENRQEIIAKLHGDEPCRIVPEPDNPYDPHALAVHIAYQGNIYHVGYIPKELALKIEPLYEGESFMAEFLSITGGFETFGGHTAPYGLRIRIEVPVQEAGDETT